MKLPTIYKRTNTGATQFWEIISGKNAEGFGVVKTTFGQIGTDKPQVTIDILREGKSIGKKNETTAVEQAKIQAKQKWEKQIKAGYVEDLEQAKEGRNELGGIKPMLAQVFEDRMKDIKFPVMVQPKLDGMRCIAVCKNGEVKLFSRTQKPINTVPHIIEQLKVLCEVLGYDWQIDGELYCSKFKDDFNEIMSRIKRDNIHAESTDIEYHIYDMPSSNAGTKDRLEDLRQLLLHRSLGSKIKNLIHVPHLFAENFGNIDTALERFLDQGYEGAMVRTEGLYEFKRSKHLLKYKKFQDAEFKVVGVDEGKGNLMGHAGSFVCLLPDGRKFNAKMVGERKHLKEMFENFEKKYMSRNLTVKFFQYTPDGFPRFPVALRFREDE